MARTTLEIIKGNIEKGNYEIIKDKKSKDIIVGIAFKHKNIEYVLTRLLLDGERFHNMANILTKGLTKENGGSYLDQPSYLADYNGISVKSLFELVEEQQRK